MKDDTNTFFFFFLLTFSFWTVELFIVLLFIRSFESLFLLLL